MNKFEQVSSVGYEMSLGGFSGPGGVGGGVGWGVLCLISGGRAGGTCTVRSNASWVMVTWRPTLPCGRMTD